MNQKSKTFVAALATVLVAAACQSRPFNEKSTSERQRSHVMVFGEPDRSGSINLPSGAKVDMFQYVLKGAEETQVVDLFTSGNGKRFFNAELPTAEEAQKVDLSHAEFLSLRFYTSIGYLLMADLFKGVRESSAWAGPPEILGDEVEVVVKGALSALRKMKPCRRDKVYFGASLDAKTVLPRLKPEEPFLNLNFTSSSESREYAKRFAAIGPGEPFLFEIPCKRGRDLVDAISFVPGEKEILYPPKFPFVVVGVQKREEWWFGNAYMFHIVELREAI